jgi:hypothetical protein
MDLVLAYRVSLGKRLLSWASQTLSSKMSMSFSKFCHKTGFVSYCGKFFFFSLHIFSLPEQSILLECKKGLHFSLLSACPFSGAMNMGNFAAGTERRAKREKKLMEVGRGSQLTFQK